MSRSDVRPGRGPTQRLNVWGCAYSAAVSDALEKWETERAEALDSLDAIHGQITGRTRGRKYNTKHLNRALFVALAAEFQGQRENRPGRSRCVVRERTVSPNRRPDKDRRLDKGNADFSALVTDFATFGINLGDETQAAVSEENPQMGENPQGAQRRTQRHRTQ